MRTFDVVVGMGRGIFGADRLVDVPTGYSGELVVIRCTVFCVEVQLNFSIGYVLQGCHFFSFCRIPFKMFITAQGIV